MGAITVLQTGVQRLQLRGIIRQLQLTLNSDYKKLSTVKPSLHDAIGCPGWNFKIALVHFEVELCTVVFRDKPSIWRTLADIMSRFV